VFRGGRTAREFRTASTGGIVVEDFLRSIGELEQRARGAQQLTAQAQALAPQHVEGSDGAEAVHVRLGPDGLPESVRVEPRWQQDLNPGQLGAAVLEAFEDARDERLDQWLAALGRERFDEKFAALRAEAAEPPSREPQPAEPPPAEAPPAQPPLAQPSPAGGRRRPISDVVADVIDAFDAVQARLREGVRPPRGTGRAAAGRVSATVSTTALVECSVDPGWAARQSAAQLSAALGQAVAAAKTDLAVAVAAAKSGVNLTGLFDELLDAQTAGRPPESM
jgi:DNA-binding protein YbaB